MGRLSDFTDPDDGDFGSIGALGLEFGGRSNGFLFRNRGDGKRQRAGGEATFIAAASF